MRRLSMVQSYEDTATSTSYKDSECKLHSAHALCDLLGKSALPCNSTCKVHRGSHTAEGYVEKSSEGRQRTSRLPHCVVLVKLHSCTDLKQRLKPQGVSQKHKL